MKKASKLFCVLIVTVLLFSCFAGHASASSAALCATYGFTVDTLHYSEFTTPHQLVQKVYNGNSKLIGMTTTTVIVAVQKNKVGNNYVCTAMYHSTMNPKSFTDKNDIGITTNFLGMSDRLVLSSLFPTGSFSYITSYPQNTSSAVSYTIGGSTSGNITGSTTITKDRIEIVNMSDASVPRYSIDYDYKTALIGTNAANDYLKYISEQRGTFSFYTSTTNFVLRYQVQSTYGSYNGILWKEGVGFSSNTNDFYIYDTTWN